MRILYVAPRFHTNQVPIMEGWKNEGSQVTFVSQFASDLEDYSVLKPKVLGYSPISEWLACLYRDLFCRHEKTQTKEYNFRVRYGFPSLREAKKLVDSFRPDLVILRERSVYNAVFYRLCRRRAHCILYNQTPLLRKRSLNSSVKSALCSAFFPKKRMTPVMGNPGGNFIKDSSARFVPFVMKEHISPDHKTYFAGDRVNILCVARYEERKMLFLLLDALKPLFSDHRLHLTIAGEAQDEGQLEYRQLLTDKISAYGLKNHVTLKSNLTIRQVFEEYAKADLFVLPSSRESASISQLEAMSCSLPVICSDNNGSACYVQNGVNGYLFADRSEKELKEKLSQCLQDKEELIRMGRESYRILCSHYQFENYKKELTELVNS